DKDFRRAMQAVEDKLRQRRALTGSRRKAPFVCALCLDWPDGDVEEFEGKVAGVLGWGRRGEEGFGHEPVLLASGPARAVAQVTNEEKHSVTQTGKGLWHRAHTFLNPGEACLATR